MSQKFSMTPIAHIHSDFAEKFGVPRQSGLVEALRSTIVFEPEFRNSDALRTGLSEPGRPPGLGGLLPHLAHLGL